MRSIKNNIELLFSDTTFVLAKANEKNTTLDIEVMGKKLAKEVTNYMKSLAIDVK